jgi:hypothetical protein
MFKECRFILPSGYKCKSPALREQLFCYFHTTGRRYASVRSTSAEPIPFPSVEDAGGIQIAINQVLRHLGSGRIDRQQARAFFQGLNLAARLVAKSEPKLGSPVREICEEVDPDGTSADLAPEESTCEPPVDCVNCNDRDYCKNFGLWKSDVEELEERLEEEREASEEADS